MDWLSDAQQPTVVFIALSANATAIVRFSCVAGMQHILRLRLRLFSALALEAQARFGEGTSARGPGSGISHHACLSCSLCPCMRFFTAPRALRRALFVVSGALASK